VEIILYSGPERSAEVVREILGSRFDVRTVVPEPLPLLAAFKECSVYLDASMKVPIPADAIRSAAALRLIVTATTGANHIDADALEARKIPLLTLKGQTEILRDITPAAEHSWLLLMACARRLRGAIRHVEAGEWERTEFPGLMLKGKTLGVVGVGRLGSWMARYAQAFGMTVQGYDPHVSEFPSGVFHVGLDELLSSSDFISVHVNLTPETRMMLPAEKIREIKTGAVFINTSRGELVDEEALVEGLREGRISSVGVDVLTGEPDVRSNPLWKYAQTSDAVCITPHVGGFSPEAVDKVVAFSCRRILEFFAEKE
jgi:phosphoglycerate dehydrogenase-like enzyme